MALSDGPLDIEKVRVRSDDGVSSAVTVFRGSDPKAPVVLCLPAMGVKARFYEPVARALVEAGLNAVTADLRGHGESAVRADRGADFGYGEMVRHDWPAIVDRVQALFPASPTVILGHSLGGQLSTLYMSENPGRIAALTLVAAPSLYFRDWPFRRGLWLLFLTHSFAAIAAVLGHHPGRRLGIGGTEARRLMRDWARITRKGRYDMIRAGVDYEALSRSLEVPLLAISFSDDWYAPRKAVDRLCARMPRAPLTRWHLEPEEMGCRSLGHFHWVKQADRLVPRIAAWLRGVL